MQNRPSRARPSLPPLAVEAELSAASRRGSLVTPSPKRGSAAVQPVVEPPTPLTAAAVADKAAGSLRNLRSSIEQVPVPPPAAASVFIRASTNDGFADGTGSGTMSALRGARSAASTLDQVDSRKGSKETVKEGSHKEDFRAGSKDDRRGSRHSSVDEESSSALSDSDRDSSDASGSKKPEDTQENAADVVEDMVTTWKSVTARLETPLLQDRRLLAEVSESMVSQLSSTFACMHQALSRERARHASGVSLMIRKVDKDLRETFQSVRDTFKVLTEQLVLLAKESETGRRQVRSIQAAYAKVKNASEAQAQYVQELEAVIDGQSRSGISAKLKKLSAEATAAQHTLVAMKQEFHQQQAALLEENKRLKKELKRMDDASKGIGLPGFVEPPKLPEMVASWTRREIRDSPGIGLGGTPSRQGEVSQRTTASPGLRTISSCSSRCTPMPMGDVVGGMLAHSDAGRSVSRCKGVRSASQEARRAATTPTSPRGETFSEVSELKRRLRATEDKCETQRKIVSFASTALLLLRDIFTELRAHRHIQAAEEVNGEPGGNVLPEGSAPKPHEVLERLVKLFYGAIPRLGNFSELLTALGEEAAGRDAEFSPVLEDEQDGAFASTMTLQPESDIAEATPLSSLRHSGVAILQN